MASFSETQIQQVWDKGKKVDGYDEDRYRKDACDAWMMREKHGEESLYGWQIDHVYPESEGGDEELVNLRPMQWENNQSKDNNYPDYTAKVTSDGDKNIYKKQSKVVNEPLQAKLKKLYNL